MISVLDPPRVEAEPMQPRVEAEPPQPLPGEKPHRVDITFRALSEARDWDSALTEWTGFVQDPATQVGFWCDPRVMCSECTATVPPREVLVAQVKRGGRLIALVPFKLGLDKVPLRLGLAKLGCVTTRCATLYDTTFAIAEGEDRAGVLERVVAETARAASVDVVVVPEWDLPADGTAPFRHPVARPSQRSCRLLMPGSLDGCLSKLRRATRQRLRNRVRTLGKAFDGELAARCYRHPDQASELEQLVRHVWRDSWHAKCGGDCVPGAEFFRQIAEQGWLRSYVLLGGTTAVACAVGYQYRDVFIYQNVAYEPEYESYSPGAVLTFLLVQDLFASDPPRFVDFGCGENQFKRLLCNDFREQRDFWFPMSARGRVVATLTWTLDAAFRGGKQLLQRTTAVQRLKRHVRGTKHVQH